MFTAQRDARAGEADGALEFDLGICHRAGRRIPGELVYATEDGTAGSESDYVGTDGGVVEFTADEQRLKVSVPVVADGDAAERYETLFLRAPGQRAMLPARARGVIGRRRGGRPRVHFYERDGQILALDRDVQEPRTVISGREPAISFDGTRLAFVRTAEEGHDELWVAGAGGGGAEPVLSAEDPGGRLGRPAWSPDGTRLAVMDLEGDGDVPAGQVHVVHVASGTSEPVGGAVEASSGTLSFSPDGTQLALDAGAPRQIERLDVETGARTPVLPGQTPSYGPDGALVFERAEQLYLLPAGAADPVRTATERGSGVRASTATSARRSPPTASPSSTPARTTGAGGCRP